MIDYAGKTSFVSSVVFRTRAIEEAIFMYTRNANSRLLGFAVISFVAAIAFSSPASAQQRVFVNFTTREVVTQQGVVTVPPEKHFYSQQERDAIVGALSTIYDDFDVTFTHTSPPAAPFSTLIVGSSFIEGGLAEQVDFRNVDHADDAEIDIEPLLDSILDDNDQTSQVFVTFTANVCAHELGHLLGLRHGDSFGPIGSGIHFPPGQFPTGFKADPSEPAPPPKTPWSNPLASGVSTRVRALLDRPDTWCETCAQEPSENQFVPGEPQNLLLSFNPIYPGLVQADETTGHIMASPASVGQMLSEAIFNQLVFSERSATKIAMSERGATLTELGADHGTIATAQILGALPTLNVPNTLDVDSKHASVEFDMRAIAVIGEISVGGEIDYYSFEAKAGDLLNLEVLSEILSRNARNNPPRISNKVDCQVTVFHSDGTPVDYYGQPANNDDEWENRVDPILIDLIIPSDDTYFVEVRQTDRFGVSTDTGDYELYLYLLRGLFEPLPPDDPDFPSDCTELGSLPATVNANIDAGGDLDVFCFEAEEGITYVMLTDLVTVPDTRLKLFDTDGVNLLALNDDVDSIFPGFNFASRIEFTAPKTGRYFVQVNAFNEAQRGQYSLTVARKGIEPPPPPTASFASARAIPTIGLAPLTVRFQGGVAENVTLQAGDWDFGDGNGSFSATAVHTYITPGTYTATFTAIDDRGLLSTATAVIRVDEASSEPPSASIDASVTGGDVPLTVVFTGSGGDLEGDLVRFDWDFDDGDTTSGEQVEHTFLQAGVYNVMLTVVDSQGTSATTNVTIQAGADTLESSPSSGVGPQPPAGQATPTLLPMCGSMNGLTLVMGFLGLFGLRFLRRSI